MNSYQILTLELHNTENFYKIVHALNHCFSRGKWTCRGRPVRKLRRLEKVNFNFSDKRSIPIVFLIPELDGIENFLALHME